MLIRLATLTLSMLHDASLSMYIMIQRDRCFGLLSALTTPEDMFGTNGTKEVFERAAEDMTTVTVAGSTSQTGAFDMAQESQELIITTAAQTITLNTTATATTTLASSAATTVLAAAKESRANTMAISSVTSTSTVADTVLSMTTARSVNAAVMVRGEMSFKVVDAEEFASDPAVTLALTRSIAQQLHCPDIWVLVAIKVEQRQLRYLHACSVAVTVLYNISIPADDGSAAPLHKAEERASFMILELNGVALDKANFQSLVKSKLQHVNVKCDAAEVVGVSYSQIIVMQEEPEINSCTKPSVLLGLVVVLLISICTGGIPDNSQPAHL